MIIVSQDKKAIINFNNVNEIRATSTNTIIMFDNKYRSSDDYSNVLGTYKNEKRAKEVLQEIIKLYKQCEYVNGKYTYTVINKPKIYEMPEN